MSLLVAYQDDPAGLNMAEHLIEKTDLQRIQGEITRHQSKLYHGKHYDLLVIPTPAISADWLANQENISKYKGVIFLSKHAAKSGELALTCHSTGNFKEADFGGNPQQVAVPYPHVQKAYMKRLAECRQQFSKFQITIEATHHGPTALDKPVIFIEVGTTIKEWTDKHLCNKVADIIHETMINPISQTAPIAICFGGTHYPSVFTKELLCGEHALGTVMPRHALQHLDMDMMQHIIQRNTSVKVALLDWDGLGSQKQMVVNLLSSTDLEIIRI